jgi:hypothetical protein
MADVTVDIETGIVKMNKFVAVQDCGMIINEKTSESQVLGAMIMGVCFSLFEERVMDDVTAGRPLNANMEFYKLAGIGDIGDFVVRLWKDDPEQDARGVIASANRPPIRPQLLSAMPSQTLSEFEFAGAVHARSNPGSTGKERRALFMNAFEYAAPTTKEQAVSSWAASGGGRDLAGAPTC